MIIEYWVIGITICEINIIIYLSETLKFCVSSGAAAGAVHRPQAGPGGQGQEDREGPLSHSQSAA